MTFLKKIVFLSFVVNSCKFVTNLPLACVASAKGKGKGEGKEKKGGGGLGRGEPLSGETMHSFRELRSIGTVPFVFLLHYATQGTLRTC